MSTLAIKPAVGNWRRAVTLLLATITVTLVPNAIPAAAAPRSDVIVRVQLS